MLKKGSKAPDFCLKNQYHQWTRLSDYRGHKICLFFFPTIDTLNDQMHVISYAKESAWFEKLDVVVLGVCGSSDDVLAKQSKRLFLPYLLLSDQDKSVRRLYDVWNEKTIFGTKRWITSRSALLIDEEGRIYHTYKRAHIERNVYEVLEYLQHCHDKAEWRKLSRRTKERIRREQSNSSGNKQST